MIPSKKTKSCGTHDHKIFALVLCDQYPFVESARFVEELLQVQKAYSINCCRTAGSLSQLCLDGGRLIPKVGCMKRGSDYIVVFSSKVFHPSQELRLPSSLAWLGFVGKPFYMVQQAIPSALCQQRGHSPSKHLSAHHFLLIPSGPQRLDCHIRSNILTGVRYNCPCISECGKPVLYIIKVLHLRCSSCP